MKKAFAIKSMLCMGAASLIITGAHTLDSGATGICAETSLAGISLSLERYIEAVDIKAGTMGNIIGETPMVGDVSSFNEGDDAGAITQEPAAPSKYENMGISIANDYVNIRSEPNTESEIMGKLYRGSAATILETVDDWVRIKSGRVEGYIKSEYLAIGFDAEELEDMFGTKWATVNTTTLKVRENKSTESIVLDLIPLDETYEVIKEYDEWVKILVDEGGDGDEGTQGYVSKEYVDISVEFQHAISIEEELEELRREEEARKAEEERLKALEEEKREQQRKLEQEKQQQQKNNSSSSSKSSSSNSSSSKSSSSSSSSKSSSSSNSSSNNSSSGNQDTASDKAVQSGDGAEIASYAQKFIGNPYVYGGTSLTNGADCSGFVQSVYAHFGISIPRSSSTQAGAGRKVSFDSLKAGDLIFYAKSGSVNHVALYIGGGQVVHASNRKTGIKISAWNYRTPYTARRIVE